MSIPAQGAVGAETAAETVTILYENYRGETAVRRITPIAREWFGSSDWHPEPQWLFTAFDMDKEAFRDFARAGVKAWGQAAVDAALASPRADSDERTAGVLWSAWSEDDCDSDPRIDPMAQKVTEWFVGRWPVGADEPECRILIGAGRSAEIIARRIAEKLTSILNTDAIQARKAATPAHPAGAVPGSLRALSEAASALLSACMADMGPLDEMDRDDEPVGMSGFGVGTAVTFGHLRRLERALASHPAGQSAGSGETIAVQKRDLVKMVDAAFAVDPSVPTEAQGDNLFAAATKLASYLPLGLECTGCGSRESIEAIQARGFSSCCPERKMQPAPDSTRTGQVGLREALARSLTKSVAGGSPDRYRIEIACPDLATMQVLRDGLVSLRDNPAAITAPHDDGFTADELREIRAAIMELGAGAIRTQKIADHQAANDLQRHCIGRIERALASRLAARPAAPDAQGAWSFDMEAAPRDGTVILLWREGWGEPSAAYWGLAPMADGAGVATKRHPWVFLDSTNGVNGYEDGGHGPMAWHPMLDEPAPPASSGQGGR